VLLTAEQKELTAGGCGPTKRRVKVVIFQCAGLEKADKSIFGGTGASDPFVVIKYNDKEIGRTPTIQESCDPVWSTKNEFVVEVGEDDDALLKQLEVEVWDEDLLSKGDFLGQVLIDAKVMKEPSIMKLDEIGGRELKLEMKENWTKKKQKLVGGKIKLSIIDNVKFVERKKAEEEEEKKNADEGGVLGGLLNSAAASAEEKKDENSTNYIDNELLEEVDEDEAEAAPAKPKRNLNALQAAKSKINRAKTKIDIGTALNKGAKAAAAEEEEKLDNEKKQGPTRASDLSVGIRVMVEDSIRESPYQVFLGVRQCGGLAPTADVWKTRYNSMQPLGLSRHPGSTMRYPFAALTWKGIERARTKIAKVSERSEQA